MAGACRERAGRCVIVEWTPRASRELLAQLQFIALDKPSAADRMAALVEEVTSFLGNWPQIGKRSRYSGLFELVIPRTHFIAVYRQTAERVMILRRFHEAQQIGR